MCMAKERQLEVEAGGLGGESGTGKTVVRKVTRARRARSPEIHGAELERGTERRDNEQKHSLYDGSTCYYMSFNTDPTL